MQTEGSRLLLAGGKPRGTLYAVSRFLQDHCGVRWWTPWASRIPSRPTLQLEPLKVQAKPAFEYREPFWFTAFDTDWAIRNCVNGQSANIPPEKGGCIRYKGFVHTFYPLVPPEKHFAEHPEWYSLIGTQRTAKSAQLCLTNPKLRDFLVDRVKQWLRESPEAHIVSVSQNDWHGACQCPECRALDEAEGSPAGSLLAAVNYVAEKIEPEFPQVAVDTLAYQYTRKPPRTIKPRPNVIVRLCSIECDFREPLEAPSNAKFGDDLRGWSRICQRLYIWDYTTDFAHYVQPHPNWFVLGPNLRFFQNLNINGHAAKTFSPLATVGARGEDAATSLGVNYRDERWQVRAAYATIGERFNDEMGFVPRRGIDTTDLYAGMHLRPQAISRWVRELSPHYQLEHVTRRADGGLESRFVDYHLPISFQDGSFVEIGANPTTE